MHRIAAAAAAALCAFATPAPAQTYPARLVRIINPVAAGGNQDIVARAYAEQMARTLGQPSSSKAGPDRRAWSARGS